MKQNHKKTLVRLTVLCFFFSLMGGVYAQASNDIRTQTVTIGFANESLREALFSLGRSAGFSMALPSDVDATRRVNLPTEERTVEATLSLLLQGTNLDFQVQGSNIVFSERPVAAPTAVRGNSPPSPYQVTGRVISETTGETLPFVTVRVRGTTTGTITSVDGNFTLTAPSADAILEFSFLGYETLEVPANAARAVRMSQGATMLEGVVITGMFDRSVETETGSSVRFSHAQLREAGNQNVLRSLANLDPSFMVIESMDFGSDPNRLPEIQMRGQSSFPGFQGEFEGSPNQPLFILDGFEATLQMIFDLDMNRVASVTILKDASAKAIYGAQAGNGVVVIETIRPQRGRVRVSYAGSFDIQVPDLTGYNLMNAREKIAFDRRAGMYTGSGQVQHLWGQHYMDGLYERVLRDVLAGVETDWLAQPLRIGLGQRHSLNFDGGDDRMLYGVGISYNHVSGVMRGSERRTIGGNITLQYSHPIGFNIRNMLTFTQNNSTNSPYGSFADFVRLKPYWRIHDEDGNLIPYWDWRGVRTWNPLFNATLNTRNTSEYTEIRNNTQLDWRIRPNLRATGRFGFTTYTGQTDQFYPSDHLMFSGFTPDMYHRRGRYTKGYRNTQSYQAQVSLGYSQVFGRHVFFANAAWDVQQRISQSHRFIAEGFSNDNMDDIAFANQFMAGSRPMGSSSHSRSIGIVGALNYSFDNRFLFDVSARSSASSMFGADNRWGHFWAVGVGWNIHNEDFARDIRWLERFKIRGSVGYTGSQNFDPFMSRARYEFSDYIYDGGFGAILLGLPNDNLRWQRVLDYNAGVDFILFNGLITAKFDYFVSITDDMLMSVALPPSVGFSTFMENLGTIENRGFDASLSVRLWHNPAQRAWVRVGVSAMHNRNRLRDISNTFDHRNQEQRERISQDLLDGQTWDYVLTYFTRPQTLFYEGHSMTSIWGVRSAGINPMTGEELFFNRDGELVTTWSAFDQVVIGDNAPTLRGNLNLSVGFRGFTFAISASYRFGGQIYNSTLAERVEFPRQVSNFDRRIQESWTEVGQVAPFRRLVNPNAGAGFIANPPRPTSRFIMNDNELFISSLNMGYEFQNLGNIGIERLRLSFHMNELVRFSSVQIERGLNFPFARTFSLSMNVTF